VLTSGRGSGNGQRAEDRDREFISRLTALDERTLALARLGAQRAARPQTQMYAKQAVASLTRELDSLDSAHTLIYGEPLPTRGKANPPTLRGNNFDQAFIDALIASHREAVQIAEREIYREGDPDLMELAQKAIDERTPQIASMSRYREDAFGAG
jgi:uncharacterized protein (DUF305 family)